MRSELYFLLGGVVGGLIGYTVTKKYYEQAMEDEANNIKEYYEKKEKVSNPETAKEEIEAMYEDAVQAFQDYTAKSEETSAPGEVVYSPEVVSPSVIDTSNDHEIVYLTWYEEDKCLVRDDFDANIDDSPVVDVKAFIGEEALDRFDEYEKDTVYVRNDRFGAYYIVTREYGSYDGYE